MNKVLIIGRLGKDPESRQLDNGTEVCSFSVATDELGPNKTKVTEWHSIVAWGGTASACAKFLKKGRQVVVEGRLQSRQYQKKDGGTAYKTEIQAEKVTFIGGNEPNRGDAWEGDSTHGSLGF